MSMMIRPFFVFIIIAEGDGCDNQEIMLAIIERMCYNKTNNREVRGWYTAVLSM